MYEEGAVDESLTEEELKMISSPFVHKPHNGVVAGIHNGAHFYTIGQRKGMNIGGHKEPLFVIETDVEDNIVYVGEGHSHPGLNRKGLFINNDEIHWIRPDMKMSDGDVLNYRVRIRYRQPLQDAQLFRTGKGLYIIFSKLQRGISAGQFAAWYKGDELIGSGVISQTC